MTRRPSLGTLIRPILAALVAAASSSTALAQSGDGRVPLNAETDGHAPIRINRPGYYYLTGDLAAPAGHHAIEISTGHVTLDLNGFTITGNRDIGSLNGIEISAGTNRDGIVIKHGTVQGFCGHGISAESALGVVIEYVLVRNNGIHGIRAGRGSQIMNCIEDENGTAPARSESAVTPRTVESRHQRMIVRTGEPSRAYRY